MPATIKHKIRLGTVFLFLLMLISGGISMYYLHILNNDSRNILRNNYISLQYAEGMSAALDSLAAGPQYGKRFDSLLALQLRNITEEGEGAASDSIRFYFQYARAGHASQDTLMRLRGKLNEVLSLNMRAIEKKNLRAERSAESAFAWLAAIAAVIFLIGITFAYNFPFIITTPLQKLMEGIREISARNYSHRIRMGEEGEIGQLASAFNRMSERLEAFESSNLNKLIFEKTRAEAVINSLQDASIGIDKNNRILFANRQALSLLGLRGEDMVGRQADAVAAGNDLFRYLAQTETTAPFKIVVAGKEHYYIREKVEVDKGDSTVIVLKNITSFKESDTAKTNFIATISHELKTPLASSDFSLKLLEDSRVGVLSDEQHRLISQLKADNQRMLRILSELLNMAQLEAGKLQMHIAPVSLQTVIQQSLGAVESHLKDRSLQLHTDIPGSLPDVPADADKIGWVLNNFLTNAIRYSPPGAAITIRVRQQENTLSCEVEDQGPGIAPAYRMQIFERYFQVPGRADNKGSGIGLAICKEFIEAMGGRIWVNSGPQQGSIFGFALHIS